MSFLGKVVMVTGATSGIGWETALRFSKLGANLALVGRNADKLAQIAETCDATKSLALTADLSKESDTENAMKKVITHFGKLNVVVNSAGIIETGSIEDTSLGQLDRMMNINLRSIYLITALAVPHLIKTRGNIVNVSSVAGSRSFPNVLAYCTSKAAVDQFSRCVALELASKGVRVNTVNPGVIVTELHRRAGMTEEAYGAFLARCKESHALGRPGQASEVARAIAFLASDEDASFITGENLHVDGGRHAMCPR